MKNLELFCETILNIKSIINELKNEGFNMQHEDCIKFLALCETFMDIIESYHKDEINNINDIMIDALYYYKDICQEIKKEYESISNADPLIRAYNSVLDIMIEWFKEI